MSRLLYKDLDLKMSKSAMGDTSAEVANVDDGPCTR